MECLINAIDRNNSKVFVVKSFNKIMPERLAAECTFLPIKGVKIKVKCQTPKLNEGTRIICLKL